MTSLRELARRGRDLENEKQRAAREAEQQAEVAVAEYRKRAMRLGVGLSLTRWAGVGELVGASVRPWILLAGVSVLVLVSLGTGILGDPSLLPAVFGGLAVLAVAVLGPWAAEHYTRHRLDEEIAWLERLPFVVIGYPDLLGWRAYPSVSFAIHCQWKPDPALIREALLEAGLPIEMKSCTDQRVELEVKTPDGSKFDSQRRWFRQWLHRVEPAFRALDREFGVVAVYFYPGTTEKPDWVPDIAR